MHLCVVAGGHEFAIARQHALGEGGVILDGRAQGWRTGEMDDVTRRARLFKECREAAGALDLNSFRAAGFVPLGTCFALSQKQLL